MKRRLFSMLLVIVMVMGMLPTTVMALETDGQTPIATEVVTTDDGVQTGDAGQAAADASEEGTPTGEETPSGEETPTEAATPSLADLRVAKVWSDSGDSDDYYTLTPAFDPETTEYTISVPDYTASVFPYYNQAETNVDTKAMIYCNIRGFGAVGYTTGNNLSLSSNSFFGVALFDKADTARVENEKIRYTVNIGKCATLKSLEVDGVESVAFDKGTNEGYHYYVDGTAQGVKLTPTAYNSAYTVTVNGTDVTSGEEYTLPYSWDENGKMEVSITVSGSNVAENTYKLELEQQPMDDAPYIMTQPASEADYTVIDKADNVEPLLVEASANGELAYQWYWNETDSNENGTLIGGATEASYTPPITEDDIGTRYYYCVVTNNGKTENNTTASDAARVTVDPDPTPKATITNPGGELTGYGWSTGYVYNVDDSATALKVTATSAAEGGEWSYQWCTSDKAYNSSVWAYLYGEGAETTSYTPSTELSMANSAGKYYGCRVTYTFKGKSYSSYATAGTYTEGEGDAAEEYDVTGAFVFIKVNGAATPEITTQPVGASYIEGNSTKNLSVKVSKADGGTLSYQWYVNDTDSTEGGTAIEGATKASYSLGKVAEGGTKYYYCIITNTIQNHTASVTTDVVAIQITALGDLISTKLSGAGTEAAPFLIADAQDYQDVVDLVAAGVTFQGKYLKQTEDITLAEGWTSIGISKTKFGGILDGNSKTVTVPEGGSPLFGYVHGATVKNLNIYGEKINGYGLVNNLTGVGLTGEAICIDNVTLKSGSSTLKSGLIGTYISSNPYAGCSATYTVTIRNCTVEEGVVIGYGKDQSMIGSFAGRVHGTIENCVSSATVYGVNYVGGIMGSQDNALGGTVIKNCEFKGTVEASGQHAGGIAGGGYSHSSGPNGSKINISNCTVTGSVTGSDKVGGIIGADTHVKQLWGGHVLKNNSFTGSVKATDGDYVGGITGFYASLNKFDDITGNYYSASSAAKGIGFVEYVDTSCATHETASGTTYINTANGQSAGIAGITKTDHNRTDDPLGADATKLCYTDTDAKVATELAVSGTYKTEYIVGEELDLTGIALTVKYNDGSSKRVTLDNATVTGYNKDTVGEQELTISYGGLMAFVTVTVKNPAGTIDVTVSVLGDSAHGSGGTVHTLKAGNLTTWVSSGEHAVDSNATVWDVLKQVFTANNITWDADDSNTQGTVYVAGLTKDGVKLSEFTNGSKSGWKYTLNGTYPLNGVAQQFLENGDVIVFHYTDDYTKEENGTGGGSDPEEGVDSAEAELLEAYKATGAKLASLTPGSGSIGGEWMALGLARANYDISDEFKQAYLDAAKAYINENYNNGKLHEYKSTENSRLILALTALGEDPATFVSGKDLLAGLTDLNWVKEQGLNGPIWALIALDSRDYGIPSSSDTNKTTRNLLISAILEAQLSNGGWSSGTTADADLTAMAIQALAPYYKTNSEVKSAVDNAIICLSKMQDSATGAYKEATGTLNAESTAQVIVALATMGINPDTDPRFITNSGLSVMDGLMLFYNDDGGFKHLVDGDVNQMATEQSYYAIVAYYRLLNGNTSLYDMSDLDGLFVIEILPSENGSITVSKSSAAAGETITVTVEPKTGYVLDKLTLNDAKLTVTDNTATFIMPSELAILEAVFVKAGNAASAIADAMMALEIEDASEDTYDLIEELREAYSSLTAAEKLEIREAYNAFTEEVENFEEYLAEAVEEATEELEEFFEELDEDDYSKKAWNNIEDVYDEALDALEEARFEEEVEELLEEYLIELEEAAAGELEVTFRLIGDWKHDDGVDGHEEYVTWIETTEYNMTAGSTVYDLFVQAIEDFDLNEKGASKNYVESIKAPDILGGYWLSEFDNGRNSGWMYTVNGDHPELGLKEQELEDGDEIIWHYVDDYTLEERKSSSKYYERWLEADDIDPETWVKRNLDKIVEIEGKGEVTPELKYSHIGKDVTLKFAPQEGWVIQAVYVDGKNKGAIARYEYEDLSMASRIEVVFALASQPMYFVDVPEYQWFYEDVQFVVRNGLFNGTGEYIFSPNAPMTRAMLVTVLYRLEGEPSVYGSSAFSDVNTGLWYSDAVLWAARNGIVTGYTNGKFGVNDNITREQMAAILYRYAQYKGYDVTGRAYLNGYADASNISSYAMDAMSWANAEGLMSGRTASTLAPAGTATRAEVAAIFHRFVENIVK